MASEKSKTNPRQVVGVVGNGDSFVFQNFSLLFVSSCLYFGAPEELFGLLLAFWFEELVIICVQC